jgi:hypothetical protein
MYRVRWLLSFAPLIAVAGCGDVLGPGDRSDLETNRQKWQASGLTSYTMTMTKLCFCADVGPFSVIVVNDSVVSATRAADGRSADPRFLPTINKLFDFIETAIADHAVRIDVQYDATRGFPREVIYDRSLNIADEEVAYTLSNVAALATTAAVRAPSHYGTAPAAPARRGSAPAVTLPLSIRTAAP